MDAIEHGLLEDLPEGWEVTVERSGPEVTVQCQHAVLGGHEFHLRETEGSSSDGTADRHTSMIVDRLRELGLLEASQRMPELTDAEIETLRAAHAVIGAAQLSKHQAHSVVGLSQSLAEVSEEAADWAYMSVELLEPWHDYPTDPDARPGG